MKGNSSAKVVSGHESSSSPSPPHLFFSLSPLGVLSGNKKLNNSGSELGAL